MSKRSDSNLRRSMMLRSQGRRRGGTRNGTTPERRHRGWDLKESYNGIISKRPDRVRDTVQRWTRTSKETFTKLQSYLLRQRGIKDVRYTDVLILIDLRFRRMNTGTFTTVLGVEPVTLGTDKVDLTGPTSLVRGFCRVPSSRDPVTGLL